MILCASIPIFTFKYLIQGRHCIRSQNRGQLDHCGDPLRGTLVKSPARILLQCLHQGRNCYRSQMRGCLGYSIDALCSTLANVPLFIFKGLYQRKHCICSQIQGRLNYCGDPIRYTLANAQAMILIQDLRQDWLCLRGQMQG